MNSSNLKQHKPVLLEEVLANLQPQAGEAYLDVTAGGGGHAQMIAQLVGATNVTLVDLDSQALTNLQSRFQQATFYNNNFADQVQQFKRQGRSFDLILADLGLSQLQLDSDRGFSFLTDYPLDMRFNQQSGLSLRHLLERATVTELATVLEDYGQERQAVRLAQAIKRLQPQTSAQLSQLVMQVKKSSIKRKIHPATQTFMALRIWVNRELESLRSFVQIAPELLNNGGRLAIISFHSLEDQIVKNAFKDWAEGRYSDYFLAFKKPIVASPKALASHPQARSAKLRLLRRH